MDLDVGEDFDGDSEFVRWATAPDGRLFRVEGGVPAPHEGPMVSPGPGDGPLDRLMLWSVNTFIELPTRGRTPTRCYVEVWEVESDGEEKLVFEETTTDIDQGRRRRDDLAAAISAGRPPAPA